MFNFVGSGMRKILILLVIVAILYFSLCADDLSRIVNGQETGYKEFKGVVGIIYDVGGGYISICTASVIDQEVLLTAGHCVYSRDSSGNVEKNAVSSPSKIEVRNGANILYSSAIAKASKVVMHEKWDGVLKAGYFDDINDIALIKLDRKLTDLEIYGLRNDPIEEEGDSGIIVGYGVTGFDKEDSGKHRKGTSTIIDMNEFRSKSFTSGSPSYSCFGDSGGPFFTSQGGDDVVSGIASYVSGGTCSYENEYVHVLSYREWIDEKMQELTGHGLDVICGNGKIEIGEKCDKNLIKCSKINPTFPDTKSAPCNDSCSGYDSSDCVVCGDGIISGNEFCDKNSVDCSTLGNYEPGVAAPCDYSCSGFDTYNCIEIVCGDGVVNTGEVCDGGSKKCEEIGDLPEGRWAPCKSDCSKYDTDLCWYPDRAVCGNGKQEGEEECDHPDSENYSVGYDCSIDCKIVKSWDLKGNSGGGGCSVLTIF